MDRWQALLDSEESRDESLLQAFLERHPSLLPGSHSVDGDSGHAPFPVAVIAKPKLPGLSDREPDFMWLATDSSSLYPVLIEIETPHKAWFYGDRAEIHSDLTHAHGQLAEWRAWFGRGHNRTAFLDYYDIPPDLARRQLSPRYVLVHGRRGNFESSSPAAGEARRAGPARRAADVLRPAHPRQEQRPVLDRAQGPGRLPGHLGPAQPHHLQHRRGTTGSSPGGPARSTTAPTWPRAAATT